MRIVVLVLGEGARKVFVPSAPWSTRVVGYEAVSRPPIFPEEHGISASNLFLPEEYGISPGTWNIPVPPTLEAPAAPYTVARETAVPTDVHSPLTGPALTRSWLTFSTFVLFLLFALVQAAKGSGLWPSDGSGNVLLVSDSVLPGKRRKVNSTKRDKQQSVVQLTQRGAIKPLYIEDAPLDGAAAVDEATQVVWGPNSLRLFDGDKILAARTALQNSAPLEYRKLRVNTTRSLPIDKFAAPAFATALLLADSRNFPVIKSEFRRQVDHCWSRLEPLLGYLGKQETEYRIWPAVVVAVHSHFGQNRKSGEPFVFHPLAVAMFLAEIGTDGATVAAGLLHDTVEDTPMSLPRLRKLFGADVANIVAGATKVSKLRQFCLKSFDDQRSRRSRSPRPGDEEPSQDVVEAKRVEQSENLRQMLLAMADDWRIIVVKCADRLHNMRTLGSIKKAAKRERIARETLDIFVPLANRCGLYTLKAELEDLAFEYLWPDEYKSLADRIRSDKFQTHSKAALDSAVQWVRDKVNEDPVLLEHGVKTGVTGRVKSLYSIYNKLRKREYENDLRNVHDLLALRLVLDYDRGKDETDDEYEERGRWLCYHAYGLINGGPIARFGFIGGLDAEWNTVTGQVKDYIAMPKPNGYTSLHAMIANNKSRLGSVVEVQIRTGWMHSIAEYGVAAHWSYKEQEQGLKGGTEYSAKWLQAVKELEDKFEDPREFMGVVRKEVLCQRVFVFGPDGTIINLARGSTALDAAFKMDVDLGIKMERAFVNGMEVPRWYKLENGDSFEIIRGDVTPTASWLDDAYSELTKSYLRPYVLAPAASFLRTRQRQGAGGSEDVSDFERRIEIPNRAIQAIRASRNYKSSERQSSG